LIDSSGSITSQNGALGKLQDAAKAFIDSLDAHSTTSRVGVVEFDSGVIRRYDLTSNFNAAKGAIDAIPNTGGQTYLSGGLEEVRSMLAASPKGKDAKVCVVFTDGDPNNPSKATTEANKLKAIAQLVIVGFVPDNDARTYMQGLVTTPKSQNYFDIDGSNSLDSNQFISSLEVCQTENPTPSPTPSTPAPTAAPPTPAPTPAPTCDKSLKAWCHPNFGVPCYKLRGHATCDPESYSCVCAEGDECAVVSDVAHVLYRPRVCKRKDGSGSHRENMTIIEFISEDVLPFWFGSLR
jgi:uncharacterized protein YegL